RGILRFGKPPGRLDDDIDAEIAPRQRGRILLLEHLDRPLANLDLVAVVADGFLETPCHGVVLEQVRKRVVVGEVIDRNKLEIAPLCECCSIEIAADSSEAVDADFDAQWNSIRSCARDAV